MKSCWYLPILGLCYLGIVKAMTFLIKAIIVILFGFIFISLGSALFYLVREKGDSTHLVKALTYRVAISFVLFVFLLIAFALGWLHPHSLH